MPILARAKNILLAPRREWPVIANENGSTGTLLRTYVIPMALIPAIASGIGYGLVGANGILFRMSGRYWGISMALNSFITSLAVFLPGTVLVDRLAPAFGSTRDTAASARLVAYSYTPAWLAGIFYALPGLQQGVVLGLYSVYLFYLGTPILKRTPEDQRMAYTIVCAIVLIIIRFVVGLLLSDLIYSFIAQPKPA